MRAAIVRLGQGKEGLSLRWRGKGVLPQFNPAKSRVTVTVFITTARGHTCIREPYIQEIFDVATHVIAEALNVSAAFQNTNSCLPLFLVGQFWLGNSASETLIKSNWGAHCLLVGDFGCVGICTFRRMASIPYCMAGL
jgi:hypothetical protein